MDPYTLTLTSTAWALASAVAVIGLGIVSLGGGRARPRGALAFGLFAIIWGIQVFSGNLPRIVLDVSAANLLYLVFLSCFLSTPYFLTEFAASQVGDARWFWRGLRVVTAGVALLCALILVTAPELLFQGVRPLGDRVLPRWGPLFTPLVVVPHFLAFGAALFAMRHAMRRSPTARTAARIATLLAGIGVYVGFAAGNNLAFYIGMAFFPEAFDAFDGGAVLTPDAALLAFVFLLLGAGVVGIAGRLLLDARAARLPHEARRDRLVAFALLAPFVWGLVEGWLALGAVPLLDTVGLWRLIGVTIIAYGIARWRTYDLPRRAKRVAATATGTGVAAATGAAAYGAGAAVTTGAVTPIIAGIVVLGAALIPAVSFARRFFGVDAKLSRRDLETTLYGQRIDAYRAALEASLARGTFDEDANFLAALRERFGITPDEDRLLTHLARSTVIIARDRDAWDAYERLRLLGEGGGGRTWLARDRARDRLVVLKEPLERWQQEPSAREAVLREARLAAKVRHPNVVAVEAVVEGKGSPVIVMEYLEGGSLGQVLRARGTLKWPEARRLMLDVLAGLEAVHANGIVHRDIKPTNILLTGEGAAKLADFGIAVAPQASGARTMVIDPTHSTIAGTLHYMAPEARAGATPDRRADVYSCAAVLHEMLYGAPPGLPSPLVVRHDLPAGIPALIARALALQPDARIATARAFSEELAKLA